MLKIGTRGSKLALTQTHIFIDKLHAQFPEIKTQIKIIKTTGDMILDKNLYEVGGKGLFVKEIEDALLNNEIDVAVHSMKDVPAFLPEGLGINCVLKREDPSDALISLHHKTIEDLPSGARIGTSSPRRAAQLLHIRPDVKIVPFRGNVGTRIEKLERGEVDASFLAVAGLKRLEVATDIYHPVSTSQFLPAIAQGAIGIEARLNDETTQNMLAKLNHQQSYVCVEAERAFLKVFGGSCYMPLAAYAKIDNNKIDFRGLIISTDGKKLLQTSTVGNLNDGVKIGAEAAAELKQQGGDDFFS